MQSKILTRDTSESRFGNRVTKLIFKEGQREITLGPEQLVLLQRWALIKERKIAPFAYEYIYMVAASDLFKIGMTTNPASRMSALQTGSPVDLEFVGGLLISGNKARTIEKAAHTRLKKDGKHHRGEWFKGNPQTHIDWLKDFANARYAENFLSKPRKLLQPNDDMKKMWLVMHGTKEMDAIEKRRNDFIWFMERADGDT